MWTALMLTALLAGDPNFPGKSHPPFLEVIPGDADDQADALRAIGIEGLPEPFRAYFERSAAEQHRRMEQIRRQIADDEISLRWAAPREKAEWRLGIKLGKQELLDRQRQTPESELPPQCPPGTVGQLSRVRVLAVLDDTRLLCEVTIPHRPPVALLHYAILTIPSTKSARLGDFRPDTVWRVRDESLEGPPDAERWLQNERRRRGTPFLSLEAIPAAELKQMRGLYDAATKK